MPTFGDFLKSRYTADEQATELFQLLYQIGVYNEASVSQEITALIDRNLDPTKMVEEDIRKFLSFFYVPIRNRVAASGPLSVQILSATGTVTFGIGDEVMALGGSTYKLTSSGLGVQGDVVVLQASQSSQQSYSGTYSDYIYFSGDNVIMESIRVYVNGVEISSVTSPRNGFMAFYFGGVVYIKVFLGTDVSQVRNQPFSVTYSICDGLAGNVDANSFSAFSAPKLDINLKPVTYAITNNAITNGANVPSLGELRDLLRYWLFVRNVLTKPSDYRRWFVTQPEVGDCLAWGDTEEYLMGAVLDITGKVRVCLLSSTGVAVSSPTQAVLDARVQPYKDVAYLQYVAPTFVKHYFEVRYTGTNDDALFAGDALAEIQARYSIDTLRANGMSLFDPLDVGLLSKVLSSHITNPTGLEVVPSFYIQDAITATSSSYSTTLPSPTNLKKGYTKYLYEVLTDDGLTVTSSAWYTEIMTSLTSAIIVDSNGTQVVGAGSVHNYGANTITLAIAPVAHPQRITIFAEALNRSYIDTGSFTSARLLAGVLFTKVIPQF